MTVRNGSQFTNFAAPCRHRLRDLSEEDNHDDDPGIRAARTRKSIKAAESEEEVTEHGSDAEESNAAEEGDNSEF